MRLLIVTWLLAFGAATAAAAPGPKQIHCRRRSDAALAKAGLSSALSNGSLVVAEWQNHGDIVSIKQNVQTRDGKLVLDHRSSAELDRDGELFHVLECRNVPADKYPIVDGPFNPYNENLTRLGGQLATEDERSCVTVRNGTVTVEDCAQTVGDQLDAQWMSFIQNRVMHTGRRGSPAEAELSIQNDTVSAFVDPGKKPDFLSLNIQQGPGPEYPLYEDGARRPAQAPVLAASLALCFLLWYLA